MENSQQVEQWGMFEAVLQGTTDGNPFKEVQIFAKFSHLDRTVEVEGFYDGDGTYRVRFMPDAIGNWSFSTWSNDPDLHGNSGFFDCVPPTGNNHGPVRVDRVFHFAYEDGSPYRPFGTTSYAWIHQSEQRQEQTLATLRESPFNKFRMCLFPKRYLYNLTEPGQFPFALAHDSGFDFTCLNPQFFSG
ncbi:MAG: hypothetical protein JWN30_1081, partial [Bacilli bacterium]|nr:hypothetical protein [Bacilli bacterium]